MGVLTWLGSVFQRSTPNPPEVAIALASRATGTTGVGSVPITPDSALRASAMWACIDLRAGLVSSMPLDVYRRVTGIQVEVTKPPLLVTPSTGVSMVEWLYSSQSDLDRFGNAFGIIAERDALGFPKIVDLVSASTVTAKIEGGKVREYRISGAKYTPEQVWHERQYTVAGSPMGLCPITYAAWSIGGYLSAQKFGNDYFAQGGAPTGVLQNNATDRVAALADEAKDRFKVASANRDIFVVGKDWTWTPSSAPEAAQAFLEEMKYGAADICRFFGVPADMVDAGVSGQSITYANMTQRNLQFLITKLGPALIRREAAMTAALPAPRFVKFNTDALLRLDPETRARVILARVAGRTLSPTEARELDNLPPFTAEQIDELLLLLPPKVTQPPKETLA